VLQDAKDLPRTLFGEVQKLFSQSTDDELIRVLFGQMEEQSQRFNQAYVERFGLDDATLPYAQLLFNSMKARSWSHIVMELMPIIRFYNSNDLKRKLAVFVFNRVALPKYPGVDQTPLEARTSSNKPQYWSEHLVVLDANTPAEQDVILAQMYRWEDVDLTTNGATPERLLLNVLDQAPPTTVPPTATPMSPSTAPATSFLLKNIAPALVPSSSPQAPTSDHCSACSEEPRQ
jgi:hypothetical protein